MKLNRVLWAIVILVLLTSMFPVNVVGAVPANEPPPAGLFQLPWDYGVAWMAIDGIDNGFNRPTSSSHHYSVGGAIDFAPRRKMIKGEDTSNMWVAAIGSGTVVGVSTCHVIIDHRNGWISQYQFLGNVQVKLGNTVDRNQRLGIIADGVRYKYCVGSIDPDIPHLHFMLRPTLVGSNFANWQVNYNSLFNTTTFSKNGETLGLYKPLLNVFDSSSSTPTPTPTSSTTPSPTAITPVPTGPYVSTTAGMKGINVGETTLVDVRLNNVPAGGYVSAEFTCTYDASLIEVSNIVVANLFGADPAVAINGPQNGTLIVAIAGSRGNRAATSGTAFTFNAKGQQAGQTNVECKARVNTGNNILTELPSIGDVIVVHGLGSTPAPTYTQQPPTSLTPTDTPQEPPASPTATPPSSACDKAEFIADVTLPPGAVVLPGQILSKTWRVKNVGPCTWTPSYGWSFVSGALMDATLSNTFADNVFPGQEADIYVGFAAPLTPGHYQSFWKLHNASGVQFGSGVSAADPFLLDIVVSGPTVTPVFDMTPSPSPVPTSTLPGDWLTFTNLTYGFQFQYPPQGQIVSDGDANFTRIDLPFTQETNLREKYLEVIVMEGDGLCQSPLASQSILESSETVQINGITFLKQKGGDGGAGHLHQWIAYSTVRDDVCVSLDFILHSLNPGNFPVPPPVFDYAAESAVFGQIASTYAWLGQTPTATPTSSQNGTLAGEVFAAKPVTIELYGLDGSLLGSATIEPNIAFTLTAPGGTYKVVASSSGCLDAEASVTLTNGATTTLASITLATGDIDSNNVIDQFDALTIGMNYNASQPSVADLNNDGIINVLDLEALAKNYRKTGPVIWQ